MPYKIRPMSIMERLAFDVDAATRMLPDVIRTVVMIDPAAVPNASKKIPPMTGSTVLTIETLDCITPY